MMVLQVCFWRKDTFSDFRTDRSFTLTFTLIPDTVDTVL